MSGTSGDGVDAVLCHVSGHGESMQARIQEHVYRPFARELRKLLLDVMAPAATRTEQLCLLDIRVGQAFADAAVRVMRRARVSPGDVSVIGSHGQTICHIPEDGATWQIGRAATIAARAGVAVVSDFRSADMAAGGHGAPLVPWTDWLLLRDRRKSRAIQNVGGIANVTWLPAGGSSGEVRAFDTGPGNMVIDEFVRRFSCGRAEYDRGGRMAARGQVSLHVLREWLREPFFRQRPPRSAGREQFGREFVDRALKRHKRFKLRPEDWVATATMLTATSIASAYGEYLPKARRGPAVDEVILCGGGAKNATLRRWLSELLPQMPVRVIDELGIPTAAKEALSFALLACARLDETPANLPRVTGAGRRVILGQVSLP